MQLIYPSQPDCIFLWKNMPCNMTVYLKFVLTKLYFVLIAHVLHIRFCSALNEKYNPFLNKFSFSRNSSPKVFSLFSFFPSSSPKGQLWLNLNHLKGIWTDHLSKCLSAPSFFSESSVSVPTESEHGVLILSASRLGQRKISLVTYRIH